MLEKICQKTTVYKRMLRFHEQKIEFNIFLKAFFPIASYGARVRGSVFKIRFRVLSKDFESIQTSPGFAQLTEEKWNQSHTGKKTEKKQNERNS